MNFNLTSPCAECPFRTDCVPGWLGEDRAEEIAHAITERRQTFACHKTVEWDEEEQFTINDREQEHCAGALIFLESLNQPNQMMRWMERIHLYDRHKLKMGAPVFSTVEDFIDHHA